jgi:hypothetical protein
MTSSVGNLLDVAVSMAAEDPCSPEDLVLAEGPSDVHGIEG